MHRVKGSVINSIILGRNYFCCLCFKTVADSAVHIEDNVLVRKHDKTFEEVYMYDILTTIFGSELNDQLSIFNAVCNQCSSEAIRSYKFYKKGKENSQKLGCIVDSLTNGTEKCLANAKGSKAGFVSINTNNLESKAYYSMTTPSTSVGAYRKYKALSAKDCLRMKPAIIISNPKPEIAPKFRPEIALKPKPEIAPKFRPEIALKPKPEIALKPKPDIAPKPKPEIALKPKPEIALKPKPEIAPKPKVLRLKLSRLNSKVLNRTMFVCPSCNKYFVRRNMMYNHYHTKHRYDVTYETHFVAPHHVISTEEERVNFATTPARLIDPVMKNGSFSYDVKIEPLDKGSVDNKLERKYFDNNSIVSRKVPNILKHKRKILVNERKIE